MSLVAYTASSDEDSDCETTTEACTVPVKQTIKDSITIEKQQNGQQQQQQQKELSKSLNLPQPKNVHNDNEIDNATADEEDFTLKLPAPKQSQNLVEEADDEFLHKKVDPSLIEKPTESLKSRKQKAGTRQPVKITIPSLAELSTADNDSVTSSNGKPFSVGPKPKKSIGLLSMLPPPKFNGTFGKPKESRTDASMASTATTTVSITKTTSLIPHSVSKRQAAAIKSKPSTTEKKSSLGVNYNNSDDSDADDDACGDFFSLNTETKLPEVSAAEINAMVAKKTNRMAEFSKSLDSEQQRAAAEANEYMQAASASSTAATDHDQINIEALIGARAAKRSRKNDIQFIDIRQDQVASTNDEWMRNRLQSETEFQPTGRLVGSDQPGAGTKKKHQITYLAHQAKANEAELQAMWATNRQSRRQTQSKYGF